jgi:hypothetical protein
MKFSHLLVAALVLATTVTAIDLEGPAPLEEDVEKSPRAPQMTGNGAKTVKCNGGSYPGIVKGQNACVTTGCTAKCNYCDGQQLLKRPGCKLLEEDVEKSPAQMKGNGAKTVKCNGGSYPGIVKGQNACVTTGCTAKCNYCDGQQLLKRPGCKLLEEDVQDLLAQTDIDYDASAIHVCNVFFFFYCPIHISIADDDVADQE